MTIAAWQRWHRRIGLILAIVIVVLCVTGILLNHAALLGLDRHYPGWGWLQDWYESDARGGPESFATGRHWFSRVGDRLFFDGRDTGERSARLLGAVLVDDLHVAAVDDRLLLVGEDGAIIEVLGPAHGVPMSVNAIGRATDGRVVLRAGAGIVMADADLLQWQSGDEGGVQWSVAAVPPPGIAEQLQLAYRGRGVSLERLTRDLHTGRLFASYGVWLVDLATLLLLFLVVSGFWIWWLRLRRDDE